jgi:alkanesulfonate monooxygenase SsuD/methylene tetrahydromethanopterin reductase-like flavin-dependent oxidoreductase (luciferase family)
MLKVIVQLYPVIPADDEAERARLRPIGRNVARYQQTLAGWNDIVRAADDLGVWGVATIEHHFHSEGYEVGPNPGVLNAYWAAITKNVRVGQLGYVMSTQNPIRVAEETAILDHLSRGRCFVGFARGYQSRWTDVLGQHLGGVATFSDGSPRDRDNRKLFEEQVALVLRAWTEESIEHRSDVWQIPYPYESGGGEWPMVDWTRRLGGRGEIDDEGAIRRVSVVPAPYTQPHPPVFVSSNSSLETIEWAARHGFVPAYFSSIGKAAHYGPAYVQAAASAGRHYALGQNQAIVRWPRIGASRQEGLDKLALYDGDIYKHFYAPFLGRIGGQPPFPANASREDAVAPMLATGLFVAGGAADVRAEFVRQWRELPAEYAVVIYHYAQQPKESVIEDLRLFMREVKPALDDVLREAWSASGEAHPA